MMSNVLHTVKRTAEMLLSLRVPDSCRNLGPCDLLLCCRDVDCAETVEGRSYSKLIDSVADDLQERGWGCRRFALPFSELVDGKAWGCPVSANRRLFFGAIVEKLFFETFSLFQSLPGDKAAARALSFQERVYRKILETAKPRGIVAIGAPRALCRAARKVKVPVVELLHGYGYAQVPWGWDREARDNLPNAIWALDRVSARTFSCLEDKGLRVTHIPDPWRSRFEDAAKRRRLPPEWARRPDWLPVERRMILYSLQWGYDGDYRPFDHIVPNGILPDAVIRAVELTRDSVYWLFRMHPVQMRSWRYASHRRFMDRLCSRFSHCEWQRPSRHVLPALLPHCDGHMSMTSTTTYDAALAGVPSLLLCPTIERGGINEGLFEDLRSSGLAEFAREDEVFIAKWVQGCRRREKWRGQDDGVRENYDAAVAWLLGSVLKSDLRTEANTEMAERR